MKWGQDDLLRRFPRSRAVTLPEAGHWMVGEQDGLLAEAIASAVVW